LLEDVLFGFALFRVTARRHECRRVGGHVGHRVAVAKGMRPEPSLARGCRRGLGFGQGGVNGVELWGGVQGGFGIRGVGDDRVQGEACTEAWSVFLKDYMHGSGDAASLRIVHAEPMCVRGIASHDATKRFLTEFPTHLVWHFGEDGAPVDAELGCVRHRRRKESEGDATSKAD
jgi:hypothetical protein